MFAKATAFPGVRRVDYLNGFDEEGEDYYNILGIVSCYSLVGYATKCAFPVFPNVPNLSKCVLTLYLSQSEVNTAGSSSDSTIVQH